MHQTLRIIRIFSIILGLGAAFDAAAAEPKSIGSFQEWSAYTYDEKDGPVCFAASQPKKAAGNYTRRGEPFVLVTSRKSTKSKGVVSIVAGYDYRAESEVVVTIGPDKFALFTHGDRAWTREPKDDAALVTAMRKGSEMVVVGTSARGTETTDTYSLLGFTAAFSKVNEACGL